MSGIKSQIDIMTRFIHFSFSSHTFLVHLILSLCPALQTKLYSWPLHKKKKLSIHKLSFFLLCLNAWVYTSQTQVCTQRNAGLLCPQSSLRNQDWHSGVNDAVPSSPSPTSSLLPSQYTNTIPQPAVWCGNSIHISCQPERFLGVIHVLQVWGEGVTPCRVPRSKSLSGSEK